MSFLSSEQVHHDQINLRRLVKRLEQAVEDTEWGNGGGQDVWLKSLSMLQVCSSMLRGFCYRSATYFEQKIKYAHKILNNVRSYDGTGLPS